MWGRSLSHLAALAVIAALPGDIAMAADDAGNPLTNDRWVHRPLIVIAPEKSDKLYQRTLNRIETRRAAFDERDMVLYTVTDQGATRAGRALTAEAATALRQAMGIRAGETTLILVGKDGGVKMRLTGQAELDMIFERIDGMPMRQREMHEQGNG